MTDVRGNSYASTVLSRPPPIVQLFLPAPGGTGMTDGPMREVGLGFEYAWLSLSFPPRGDSD